MIDKPASLPAEQEPRRKGPRWSYSQLEGIDIPCRGEADCPMVGEPTDPELHYHEPTPVPVVEPRPSEPNIEQMLREEWWSNHGCPIMAQYGDDGEMQCNAAGCLTDFKRMPIEQLAGRVQEMRCKNLARKMSAAAPPQVPSPDFPKILERERTKVCDAHNAIKTAIDCREWLTEGRGPYAYNDDRWHDEFGAAIAEIREALKPLARIASDLSNCPRDWDEIQEARKGLDAASPAGSEVSREPISAEQWLNENFPSQCEHSDHLPMQLGNGAYYIVGKDGKRWRISELLEAYAHSLTTPRDEVTREEK